MYDIMHKIDRNPWTTGLVCGGFLILYFFMNTMTLPLDHNEHMYVTAGYLMKSQELYRDYGFLQTPYMPIVYNIVFKAFKPDHLLLAARLCSLFFTLASCVLLWLIIFRKTGSYALSYISTMFFGLSYFIHDISVEAANYMMPMAATLLAIYLYQRILHNPELRLPKVYCVGVILGISVGAKLYFAVFLPPFLVCLAIFPKNENFSRKSLEQIAPFLLGLVVGLIPLMHYVNNYPETFWFNNFTYHILNSHWRGFTAGPNIVYRVSALIDAIVRYPSNLAFAVIFFSILIKTLMIRDKTKKPHLLDDPITLLSAMLVVVGLVMGVIPLPMFVYYFSPAFAFAIILGCCMICGWPLDKMSSLDKTLVSLGIIVMIGSATVSTSERLGTFTRVDSWVPIQVHRTALDIRYELGPHIQNGKVATLSPLYAVEAKLKVYPQFSTGPFIFRVGNQVSSTRLNAFKGVSPLTLDSLFKTDPPAAILVGSESSVESPLITSARNSGFQEKSLGPLTLFFAGTKSNDFK